MTFMSCKLYFPTFLIGGSTNRRWALDETVLVLVPSRREAEKVPCWVRPVAGGKPGDHNFGIIVFRKLKMMGFQVRNLLFQGAIFRLHVKLLEVFWLNLLKMAAVPGIFWSPLLQKSQLKDTPRLGNEPDNFFWHNFRSGYCLGMPQGVYYQQCLATLDFG